jgi:hypothetical protein
MQQSIEKVARSVNTPKEQKKVLGELAEEHKKLVKEVEGASSVEKTAFEVFEETRAFWDI